MLDAGRINEISERAVRAHVGKSDLERILTQPATDSEGNAALRITLVLKQAAVQAFTGEEALNLLVEIQQSLHAAGEERFPIVEYATEEELADEDGPEDTDSSGDEG